MGKQKEYVEGNSIVSLKQVWALVWLPRRINFTWKHKFRWGLTLSLSRCLLSVSTCTDLMPVFICVYVKELLWLRCTSSHAAGRLSATIEGNCLLVLINLTCYYKRCKRAEETFPFSKLSKSLTLTQMKFIHAEKVREVQEGVHHFFNIKRPQRRTDVLGRKFPLQPWVQRLCCG